MAGAGQLPRPLETRGAKYAAHGSGPAGQLPRSLETRGVEG